MIPTSDSISITINLASPTGPIANFSSVLGVFEHSVELDRKAGPFRTVAQLESAGFTAAAAPEVNAWGRRLLQLKRVTAYVGRKIPAAGGPVAQAWQVDDSLSAFVDMTAAMNSAAVGDLIFFPASEDVGDYFAIGSNEPFAQTIFNTTGGVQGVGGVVAWEYWNGSAWVAVTNLTDATSGFTAALGASQAVTWDLPTDWVPRTLGGSASLFYIRARVTTVYGTNPTGDSGTVGGDADYDVALSAIEEAPGDDWIFTTIESREDQDILDAYDWHSGRPKFLIYQTDDPTLLGGIDGNIADQLKDLAAQHVAGFYYADDSVYADAAVAGYCCGFDLDAPGGRQNWRYKEIKGVPASELTTAQYNDIVSYNANVTDLWGGKNSVARGRVPDGNRIDTITTMIWLELRLTEAFVRLWQTTDTPFIQSGIDAVTGAAQAVFDTGVRANHFAAGALVTAPSLSEISEADKISGTLRLTASAVLAGSIEAVDIEINLEF